MEMRTDKFMIYVFSAIMLGGMVACSSDDPETDTGNGNGNGGNAEAPYVWGAEGAIKTWPSAAGSVHDVFPVHPESGRS